MELGKQIEMDDLSTSTIGSMQVVGSNNFGHNLEFMSRAYLKNRSSEIDIEDEATTSKKNRPLPIYLKFVDVEYKVKMSQNSSKNAVKAVVSKLVSQLSIEQDNYKQILKGLTGSIGPGEILGLLGPSGSGKTTFLKKIGREIV